MALAVLLIVVGTERMFVHPRVDEPGRADAIYVLGGGGERVPYAVDLARLGVASEVVFASVFVESEGVWSARPCNSVRPERVPDDVVFRCVQPDPLTTRGEAQMLRDQAQREGWSSVVVVVSTDQVTRARRLIERCWDGDVRIVAVSHSQPWPVRAAYEWGASLKAAVIRGC